MKFAEKHKLNVLPAIHKYDEILKSNDFRYKIKTIAVHLSGGNF